VQLLGGGAKGLDLGNRAIAIGFGRRELLLECPDPIRCLLSAVGGLVQQLVPERRHLALGAHRTVKKLLSPAIRLLRGLRGPRDVARACFSLTRPGRGLPQLELERADVFDGLVLLLAELFAKLGDLIVPRTDQPPDLLVIDAGATGTGEPHPLSLPEPARAQEGERDDRHHECDRGETRRDGLHETPRLTGGLHDRRIRLDQLDGCHGLTVPVDLQRCVDVQDPAVAGGWDGCRLPVRRCQPDRAIVPALRAGLLSGRREDERARRGPDPNRADAFVEDLRLDGPLERV
jgi:hypothetical protein